MTYLTEPEAQARLQRAAGRVWDCPTHVLDGPPGDETLVVRVPRAWWRAFQLAQIDLIGVQSGLRVPVHAEEVV